MFNEMYKPAIYSASKIWHNTKWVELRDVYGFLITARWINVECGTYENTTGAKVFSPSEKTVLWQECHHDVSIADMTVVYAEERDELRGAVMEWGINMGQNKPTYIIGDCPFFRGNDRSDAAYMHHPLVHKVHADKRPDGSYDYLMGYRNAVNHYLSFYHTPERVFARTTFLNENTPRRLSRGLYQEAIAAQDEIIWDL